MKQLFTLLIILLTGSKLSAFVHSPCTPNLLCLVTKYDSTKLAALNNHSESMGIPGLTNDHSYSLRLFASSNHAVGLKVPGSENNHNYGVKLLAGSKLLPAAIQADSLIQPIPANYKGSGLYVLTNHSESIQTPALARNNIYSLTFLAFSNDSGGLKVPGFENSHAYSIKISAAANHTDNLLQPVSATNLASPGLYALTNHSDSIQAPALPGNYIYSLTSFAFSNDSGSLKIPGTENNHACSVKFVPMNLDSLKVLAFVTHLKGLISLADKKRADSLKLIEYAHLDSLKQQLKLLDLDHLKQTLRTNNFELLKGPLYSEIALRYLDYDTLSNKSEKLNYQNNALRYTLMALHQYSAHKDTSGLIVSFNNLAKVYLAEKKFSEAKWFILQSNTLARTKKDVPGIISSLVTLSIIKSDIKDYTLAMRDLNEALQLSISNHYPAAESDVLKNYAQLYSRLKNYPKEALILKRRDSVLEGIKKDEEARLMAKAASKDSLQVKKLDSLQNKKKAYISNSKKLSKGNSSKKTDSL